MSGDAAGEFVDSNVLVYAHDATAGAKAVRARALIEELWQSERGCLSMQVLQEFFVTVTRKLPRPLDARRAAEIIEQLSHWRVHSPVPDDALEAIELHLRARVSFWEAMVVRSAQQLGCCVLWSEDLTAERTYSGVLVRNPFA